MSSALFLYQKWYQNVLKLQELEAVDVDKPITTTIDQNIDAAFFLSNKNVDVYAKKIF